MLTPYQLNICLIISIYTIMLKEKPMSLYAEAIKAGNAARFIEVLNFQDGYPVLDEATEALLLLQGNRQMLEYYLKSHVIWQCNEALFETNWPDLYAQQQKRFAH